MQTKEAAGTMLTQYCPYRPVAAPLDMYDGWCLNRRSPRIGDMGTIVNILQAPGLPRKYVVESSRALMGAQAGSKMRRTCSSSVVIDIIINTKTRTQVAFATWAYTFGSACRATAGEFPGPVQYHTAGMRLSIHCWMSAITTSLSISLSRS